MLTGVVLERLPRWATEDAGKGQRLPAAHQGRPLAAPGAAAHPGGLLRLAVPLQTSSFAEFPDVSDTPVLKYISGPELTQAINEFTDWFVGGVDTFTIWLKDIVTEWLINPLQDLLAAVALVGDGPGPAGRRLRARRLAPGRDHAGLRGGHPLRPGCGTTRWSRSR